MNPEIAYTLLLQHQHAPNRTHVCIVPTLEIAQSLMADLEFLKTAYAFADIPAVALFPPFPIACHVATEKSTHTIGRRAVAQYLHLHSQPKPIILTTLEALSLRCPGPSAFARFFHTLSVSDTLSPHQLGQICFDMGYESQDVVDEPGSYALRGFVIDIFSPLYPQPIRLEFCGDNLESIWFFDLYTQHTTTALTSVTLIAPRLFHFHQYPNMTSLEHGIATIAIPVHQKYQIIDSLREHQFVPESDLLELSCGEGLLPSYAFFADAKITIIDGEACVKAWHAPLTSMSEPPHIPISRSPVARHFVTDPKIILDTTGPMELSTNQQAQKMKFSEFHLPKQGRTDAFTQWLSDWVSTGGNVAFSYQSHLHSEKMRKLISSKIPSKDIQMLQKPLSASFLDHDRKMACLRTADVFRERAISHEDGNTSKYRAFFSTLKNLHIGDYVIHSMHGIAKYLGLSQIPTPGMTTECMVLLFSHDDKLFVPMYRLHTIQKYRSAQAESVLLDSLRKPKFQKRKQKIIESISLFAQEIIQTQAKRKLISVDAFSPVPEEEAFVEEFPFEETRDQTTSTCEILSDLEKNIPMDRLLCGDVGFGKTEVAFRAIFRVLSHRKQVAILAPTTLLAHQHTQTAKLRFASYPFRFESLSRLRTAQDQKKILKDLQQGNVHCIIGTHRLLQKDVQFHNLALVVIDEEQKFGVKHKQQLKRLKLHTHTLSLSATPIPRTLHQSMMGMQSLSILMTPPTNRLPIHTTIAKPEISLLKEAINQEVERKGQIFCVVPRVADIAHVESLIRHHTPHVAYGVAHGQMNEEELEMVMRDFYDQQFSLLISTTIIESGLDVPTANTMLVFRSHMFGLSQLYQLRGRIGRSQQKAFCYLFLPEQEEIPRPIRNKLGLLLRYNDLGSGFQVAHHDLEVRGAGNILGQEQSGFIHEIGAELYFDILDRAIKQLQGSEIVDTIDPEIIWPWPTIIPETYLPSIPLRLECYQSLASAESVQTLNEKATEIENRFGAPPETFLNLVCLHEVRHICKCLGIRHLEIRTTYGDMTFTDRPQIAIPQMIAYLQGGGFTHSFRESHKLRISRAWENPGIFRDFLVRFAQAVVL